MSQAPESTTFSLRSHEVAKAFIHTVILVDDKAFPQQDHVVEALSEGVVVVEPESIIAEAKAVPEGDPVVNGALGGGGSSQIHEENLDTKRDAAGVDATSAAKSDSARDDAIFAHDSGQEDPEELDAKSLIRLFAKDGLVCGVLDPENATEAFEGMVVAARRADVVVLDWVIRGVQGDFALNVIEKVLIQDREYDGRLRLIAIYTGDLDLRAIIQKIRDRIVGRGIQGFEVDDAGLALTNPSTRIIVLAKPHSRIPAHEAELYGRKTEIARLPDRLCQEFARLANGLVPNVALRSFAVLRDHTHEVLRHMHARLDAPFVAHRSLLPQPDDAVSHAVDLVAGEISSLLHAYEVGREADADMTEAWVKSRGYDLKFEDVSIAPAMARDVGVRLARDGANSWDGSEGKLNQKQAQKWKRDFHKRATKFFGGPDVEGHVLDSELAVATSQVRRYEKKQPLPRLTLGTVIKIAEDQDAPYLVCLQPRCDSVRIPSDEPRKFLFLPAVTSSGAFNLVVHDNGYKSLKIHQRPYESVVLGFAPAVGAVVRAEKNEQEALVFRDADGRIYRWIAQLKDAEAQRIANAFAATLARVGLNEVEWLRRSAQNRDDE